MIIDIKQDRGIQELGYHFDKYGHDIRLVGGAVRDILLNDVPKDYDFATTATPDQMLEMEGNGWKIIPTGIEHGTVTFMCPYGCFEVTTLRKDVETDGRHAKVEWTSSWEEDAARRDFTINAMSMDMDGNVYDYFHGKVDLAAGCVTFVGNAHDRIKEDALRIIRYLRFMAKPFAKIYDMDANDIILDNLHLLKNISVERVWQEIKKAKGVGLASFLNDLYEYEVLEQFGFDFSGYEWMETISSVVDEYPEFHIAKGLDFYASKFFAETFRLSVHEREMMEWFSNQINWTVTKERAEDLINENVNKTWIICLAAFQQVLETSPDDLQRIINEYNKRELPVRGQDFLDRGFTGKEIGDMMKEAKARWKNSRYTLSKDSLLDQCIPY